MVNSSFWMLQSPLLGPKLHFSTEAVALYFRGLRGRACSGKGGASTENHWETAGSFGGNCQVCLGCLIDDKARLYTHKREQIERIDLLCNGATAVPVY